MCGVSPTPGRSPTDVSEEVGDDGRFGGGEEWALEDIASLSAVVAIL